MSPQQWERVKELFLDAIAQPAEARQAFVRERCSDTAVLVELDSMLLEHGRETRAPQGTSACAADSPPPAPTRIGPYKLLEQIGEGGMGVVYLAEQEHPVRRKVALKLIKPGVDTQRVIARFEAERQALALMDHPNISRVFDAGTTEAGRPYFVMELVKGAPITTYCDELRLTPAQRLELFVSVCQAIQHAHQKGVIHRDLKPSNVLVALYDDKPVPKVIDFGVAKATGELLTERTMFTGFGEVIGTLQYMSPEQAEQKQLDVDARSDVYALGVLLYELLTGTTPLEGRRLKKAALLEALRVIREEDPPRPSTRLSTTGAIASIAANRGLAPKKLNGLVRGELDSIVMKCLEKERVRRYDTAGGLADDVGRYLRHQPVAARPPTRRYRLRKFARRHRGAMGFVATILIVISSAAAIASWRTHVMRQESTVALDQRTRARVRLYEAAKIVPALANKQFEAGRYEEARETYQRFVGLAAEVYAPGELEMVHYRLKYATAVGNSRGYAEAERLILEAVADSRAHGSFGPWIEYDSCERLVYLYQLSNEPEKSVVPSKRFRELKEQLAIKPYIRSPLLRQPDQPGSSPTSGPSYNR